ncbi:MAG TPA: GNAT family N-acetyltransferase [Pyrinomonadaceae bacterium]|nr:GNAT family N-acetyltransferase [Pyrinomonadaceae bacterium]
MSDVILQTDRLQLRRLTPADATFIFELVNEPSFIENIGDRNVRSEEDAVRYIQNGPMASYERYGYGLYKVELRQTSTPIGICGPLKRETLEYPDIGFAFLPLFWGQGYALESSAAVMNYSRKVLGLDEIAAITTPTNERSIKLLEKLGFKFQCLKSLGDDTSPIKLFLSEPGTERGNENSEPFID